MEVYFAMAQERFNDFPIDDLNTANYPVGKVLYESPDKKMRCWIDEKQRPALSMPTLHGLGIMGIRDIKSHRISHRDWQTFHQITFYDDSYLDIVVDRFGVIHESSSSQISMQVIGDGQLIVYKNHAS